MSFVNNDVTSWPSAYKHALALALLVSLVYVPVLFFPYLLLDDNWIVRKLEAVPSLDYIAAMQGRPVFAILIRLTRVLTGNSETPVNVMAAMTLVRGLAIVGLCGFTVGFFNWLMVWGSSVRVAFLTAALAATLPSLAMYVLGGPWLTVALLGSLVSVYFVLYAVLADSRAGAARWALGAVVVQGLCWCTYQGTVPVAAALVLVVFVGSNQADWDLTHGFHSLSQRARFILLGILVFIISMLVYVICWKLVVYQLYGEIKETRYSPSAINLLSPAKLAYFFQLRLTQIMNLWDVSGLSKSVFYWLSLLGVLLAVSRDWFSQQSKLFTVAKWALVLLGLILVDLPALSGNASDQNASPVFSYMTSAALVVAFAGIFSYRLYPLVADAKHPLRRRLLQFAVLATALTLSMRLTLTHFAVPLWLEYRYVRSEIERFSLSHGGVEGVRMAERGPPLLGTGLQEFSWSNLQSAFYINCMVRNVLDDLKLKSRIRIDVTTASGQVVTSPHYDREPDPSKILTIETLHLRLD